MDDGIVWLILIIAVAALVIGIVVFALLLVAYALAFLGLAIIIPLDFISTSFSWLGVSNPAVGWLLLGYLIGATIGLSKGLKKAGRRSGFWKVYAGAAGVFVILCVGSLTAYTSIVENKTESTVTPSSQQNASPAVQPDLLGTWTGTFNGKSATLVVDKVKIGQFHGVLAVGNNRLEVTGYTSSGSQQVTIKETRVLSRGSNWTLGTDTGSFTRDGRSMSGTGNDGISPQYSWSFTK
jgi:hypothetical protein